MKMQLSRIALAMAALGMTPAALALTPAQIAAGPTTYVWLAGSSAADKPRELSFYSVMDEVLEKVKLAVKRNYEAHSPVSLPSVRFRFLSHHMASELFSYERSAKRFPFATVRR